MLAQAYNVKVRILNAHTRPSQESRVIRMTITKTPQKKYFLGLLSGQVLRLNGLLSLLQEARGHLTHLQETLIKS